MKFSVHARAALAGNPSDIYGGAVLAIPVRAFAAHAEATGATVDPPSELVAAALARTNATGVRWSTDIPRSVGLAGSSALVLATLRAGGVALEPLALAQVALSIERDDLGIPGGLQDRVTQAFDAPVLVDASGATPTVTSLRPARDLRFVVAWLPSAAADSGDYHARVAESVPGSMSELAAAAHAAAIAFRAGDAEALAENMAASAVIRARLAPLSAQHHVLADAVAAVGLCPNSTGSGGAVAAVVTSPEQLDALATALRPIGAEFVIEHISA